MIRASAVIISVKKTWLETSRAPTDTSRTPNPSVLSILQFVPV